MDNLAEILEQELEEAVEVKNKKSLHRYIVLLIDNVVKKSNYDQNLLEVKSEIRLLAETMKEGFKSIDKRFEDINKRFEDMNKRFEDMNKRFEDMNHRFEDMSKRFNMMFTFMNIGFGIIILITILFKFLQ